jgi:prepilin-type N-terminal cleavage/methylation domain-containing protein
MNQSKGFTIIELIVVIAIIAVLAAIVLVNVTGYINKSKNAAVKANLSTMLTNAAVYFDANPSSFGATFITTSGYLTPAAAAASANGSTAVTKFGGAADQTWCACSPIYNITSESGYFCVDSTGTKKVEAACGSGTTCQSAANDTCP